MLVNAKAEFAQQNPEALDVILGWTLLGFPELTLQLIALDKR